MYRWKHRRLIKRRADRGTFCGTAATISHFPIFFKTGRHPIVLAFYCILQPQSSIHDCLQDIECVCQSFSALIAVITLFGVMYAIAKPAALLQCFLFIGSDALWLVCQSFHRHVCCRGTPSRRQKDWLQVNANRGLYLFAY